MKQIRYGVFETNSSSTHSLTICMKSDYEQWKNGKVYLNKFWLSTTSKYKDKKFITKDEAIDILINNPYRDYSDYSKLNKDELEESFREDCIYTFDNYDNDELEDYYESFITPNGEEIIAFGQYGYDG